jgi:hypothetical protein
VNTNGTYILYDSTILQHIIVTKSGSLPVANAEATVTVTNTMNAVFDDITFADALTGMTDYRCIYVKNAHGSESMLSFRIWLEQDPVGASTMTIGVDPGGVGFTANTIPNENTAPAGVTFSSPTINAPLTLGGISAGSFAAFWIKRVIPSEASSGITNSLAKIGVTFL